MFTKTTEARAISTNLYSNGFGEINTAKPGNPARAGIQKDIVQIRVLDRSLHRGTLWF